MIKPYEKVNIARVIFLNTITTLKSILSLLEFKLGKTTEEYKYAKKEIMNYTYNNLIKTFHTLESNKIIQRCSNKCNLRQGWKDCSCGGSGFANVKTDKA